MFHVQKRVVEVKDGKLLGQSTTKYFERVKQLLCKLVYG